MNRNRPRDNRNRDRGGRGYGGGGDGLLGEGPSAGGPPGPPMMGANPIGLRDTQLALAQSLIQQQQLMNAGLGGGGGEFGSLGGLAGGMHFLQQQQQQMRAPLGGVGGGGGGMGMGGMGGGMGGMRNDRKRSGGQMRRDNDEKRGRRDSWGRGERDRSHGNNNRSGQDRERNRSSRWESDNKDKRRHGEDYDPAEPTEDDDEGGHKSGDGSNLYCHVCSVSVYDDESFQRHLNGLKHKARMESIASVHQMRSTQLKSRLKAEEHLRNIERKGGRDPDYFCKICNNDLAIPWEKHRYSNIHKQRLLQVRKGCGWCKVHDFTNFTEVLEHRETDEHKKNAELYGKKDDDKDDDSHRHSRDGKERERSKSCSDKGKKSDDKKDEVEEEEEEDLTIPEFNAEVPVGLDYVIPVTGYFCKLCHKFYNKKSARATHCQSSVHYEKFKEATEVKIAAREKRKEEERLRKEKEAEEEAMEGTEGGDDDKKDGEDENGDEVKEECEPEVKEAMEEEEEEEQDDGILDEEDIEDMGGEGEEGQDQFEEDQDLSGSIGGDADVSVVKQEDESGLNVTMASSSFTFVSGDDMAQAHLELQRQEQLMESKVNKAVPEEEEVEAGDGDEAVADESLADAVTSELSQASLNPEEGDDDLDLSVPEDSTPAIVTSTPIVVEEAPAPTPPPAAPKGRGTAKRGRGRGRAKK